MKTDNLLFHILFSAASSFPILPSFFLPSVIPSSTFLPYFILLLSRSLLTTFPLCSFIFTFLSSLFLSPSFSFLPKTRSRNINEDFHTCST